MLLTPHPAQTHLIELMQVLFDQDTVCSVDISCIRYSMNEVPNISIQLYASESSLCRAFSRTCESVSEAEAVLETLDKTGILI
jgi:hypothetical protein